MNLDELMAPLEAVLFASGDPVSAQQLMEIFGIDIESLDEDENSADVAGEYLRVYDAGNHAIGVESSYDTKLTIYTSAGQIARILDVRAGTSKYSGFASGIYIIGQKKLSVK